jgi:FdhD protein
MERGADPTPEPTTEPTSGRSIAGALTVATCRSGYDGALTAGTRAIPVETPVAIELNGVAYAVMMASPCDLEDFVTGFLLSEGLADAGEIGGIALHEADGGAGIVARMNLPEHRIAPVMERARRRLGDSSCGICGLESIDMALRPLPALEPAALPDPQAIERALRELREAQVLGRATGATHAAGFCLHDGALVVLREDVGRHNALDKVIGSLARAGQAASEGFLVVTSRASYELVEKAVRARCPLLVAISAPTSLAVERARAAGLALAVIARDDSMLWVSGPALPPEQNRL